MSDLSEYLPFLIPFIIAELGLGIFSAIHVWKHRDYRFGNMAVWLIVVLLIQLIGPVVYFVFGRGYES